MVTETVFRIAVILAGIVLLLLSFFSLVKKKMTEGFWLGWASSSVLLIIIGIVPCLCDWTTKLSVPHIIALFLFSAFVVGFIFRMSMSISLLSMKNQEIAMQVSLINQENERILNELEKLTGKNKVDL